MEPLKIPEMDEGACKKLLAEEYVCRLAFHDTPCPFISPLFYVFDGERPYFLATRYGRKIELFQKDPHVVMEVEQKSPDLEAFRFVTLSGLLVEVTDPEEKRTARKRFVRLIRDRGLSSKILTALGYAADQPVEILEEGEANLVWKLSNVQGMRGLKND